MRHEERNGNIKETTDGERILYNQTQYKMIMTEADAVVLHKERKNILGSVLRSVFVYTFM